MNLRSVARALGGNITGGHVMAPGPGHSKHDRSLAVFVDPHSPDMFRVHSFSGDRWQDCRDYVKTRIGIADAPAICPEQEPVKTEGVSDGKARTIRALTVWSDARNLEGTPGMTYLHRRGVDLGNLPPDIHNVLRWHPSCPWEGGRHGAIVALFTHIITGEPRGIHRIALTLVGEKVGKKMLGPVGGCVMRLWSDEDVTTGLALGEGIETTLAAATRIAHKGTRLAPAWACGSAGTMGRFPVLTGVEALTLLVDNDETGAGQEAAAQCSAQWTAAGREVGMDFADIVERAA